MMITNRVTQDVLNMLSAHLVPHARIVAYRSPALICLLDTPETVKVYIPLVFGSYDIVVHTMPTYRLICGCMLTLQKLYKRVRTDQII